ncbi:MAG: hypothetical protein ACTHLR_07215 [Rhizomicrobium sp.]
MAFPISRSAGDERSITEVGASRDGSGSVLLYAAAGTLAASGALLFSGCRRTGLVAAAVGTGLAMIDQQKTVRVWWHALPGYLDEAQSFLNRVQGAVDDVTAQQRKVRDMFSRAARAVRA